jgi:hypothetical protein
VVVGKQMVLVWRREHRVLLEWWDLLVCILLIAKAYGHPPFLEENATGNGNLNAMSISFPVMLYTNAPYVISYLLMFTAYLIPNSNASKPVQIQQEHI